MRWIKVEGIDAGHSALSSQHSAPAALWTAQSRDSQRIMIIVINGEERDFPDGLTLGALIAQLGMKADRVAVELNLEIVPRPQWESTALKDGDKLEIVHFVGGGSTSSDITSSPLESPEWLCPACERAASGRFCSSCGERKSSLQDLSLGNLASHAAGEFFHYDSKMFRTFRLLFTRPGFLSAEYTRGARKPYLHPVQVFFIANVLYFLLQPLTTWSGLATYLPLHENSPFYGGLARRMEAHRLAATGITRAELAPRFTHVIDVEAKSLVIIMVPLFAGMVLLLEWGEKRFFGEHMVFALHFYAFWLISVLLVLYGGAAAVIYAMRRAGLPITFRHADGIIYLLGSVFLVAYVTKALRRFYHDRPYAALGKSVVLIASTLVLLQVYRFILFITALYSA